MTADPEERPSPMGDNVLQPPATPPVIRHSSPDSVFSLTDVETLQDTPTASAVSIVGTHSLTIADGLPIHSAACAAQLNVPASTMHSASNEEPPKKRRKLLPSDKAQESAEREAKKAQREAEQRAKEAEKAHKAEEKELEKKLKVEERKIKVEEKKQKQQEKDQAKRKKAEEREEKQKQKELGKQQKMEEQLKRERSQMRLSNFFGIPKVSPLAAPNSNQTVRVGTSLDDRSLTPNSAAERRRSLSLEPGASTSQSHPNLAVSSTTPTKAKRSRGFLPFVVGNGVSVAAFNSFLQTDEERNCINRVLDQHQHGFQLSAPTIPQTFSQLKTKRGYEVAQVQQIVRASQICPRTSNNCMNSTSTSLRVALRSVPIKHFFFGEDVRPPYLGTWTRPVSPRKARRLALAPMTQQLSDVHYDVDSEAEWDDAEEGEDIDIDGEDDEEDDEEEIEGFIDDDHAPQYLARRGLPVADVETKCSGVQWEDAEGKLTSASSDHADANFDELAICFLMEPTPKTIDPFTTVYWDPEPKAVNPSASSLMGPPRLPLSDRTNGQSSLHTILVNRKVPKAVKAAPRLVPPECMADFRAAVDGSDMTKLALIEALKKQFPKLKKDEIAETIKLIAHRVGSKREDKRWELIPGAI